MEPTPLSALLQQAMEPRGWKPADLHRALKAHGLDLSLQAVCGWLDGGGMRDRHRPVVAEVLGLQVDVVLRAAAGMAAAAPDAA